jgi:hypothetical protein
VIRKHNFSSISFPAHSFVLLPIFQCSTFNAAAITFICPHTGSAWVTLPKKWKNKPCDLSKETYLYSIRSSVIGEMASCISVRNEKISWQRAMGEREVERLFQPWLATIMYADKLLNCEHIVTSITRISI